MKRLLPSIYAFLVLQVNLPIAENSRMQVVSLAGPDADLPQLFGETVVTGYGSVVISNCFYEHEEEKSRN